MDFIYSFLSDGMDQRPAYGYSHRLRAAVEKDQITPSPLDYYPERAKLWSSQAYTFGHRPKAVFKRESVTPGPGEYFTIDEVKPRRKSGYSFGSRPGVKRPHSHPPGPKYDVSDVGGAFHTNRGFSFGHRTKLARNVTDTPGPGEYNSTKFILKSTPAFSFGRKNQKQERNELLRNKTPAPVDYHPEASMTKSSPPSFTFGKKSRGKVFVCKDISLPGPGEYEIYRPSMKRSGKGFSFGLRFPTLIK